MHQIQVSFQGFGEIQPLLIQPSSVIVAINSTVEVILSELLKQQPHLSAALERCACAVGDEMLLRDATLDHDCTLVLLSPVAGG